MAKQIKVKFYLLFVLANLVPKLGYAETVADFSDQYLQDLQNALGLHEQNEFITQSMDLESSIDQFIVKAIEASPAYRLAVAQTNSKVARFSTGEDAFLPILRANGSVNRTESLSDDLRRKSEDALGSVRLGWNLYRGGIDGITLDRNEIAEKNSEIELNAIKVRLSQQIKVAFFRFNQDQMGLALSNYSLKNAVNLLDLSRQKKEAGVVGGIDVIEAQMQEQQARANLGGAMIRIENSRRELNSLISPELQSEADFLALLERLSKLALPIGSPGVVKVESRPKDFQEESTKYEAELADKDLSLSRRGRYLPTLDLVSDYTWIWQKDRARSELNTEMQERQRRHSYGLELSIPLYEPKADSAIYFAKLDQETARMNAAKVGFDADQRWHLLQANYRALSDSLPSYSKAYQSALELYNARIRLYRAGAADMFAVVFAESSRLTALSNWFEARSQVQNARLSLEAAQKGLILP